MPDPIMNLVVKLLIETPARGTSFRALRATLENSGRAIEGRISVSRPSQAALHTVRHIVGIEAWGARRLRVALGEPLLEDGHSPYKPQDTLDLKALLESFKETRRATLELTAELERAGIRHDWSAPHNSLGSLTARGWLRYLNVHADLESRKLRR